MKQLRKVMVRLDSEFQEKIGSIYVPKMISGKTVKGTLIGVPDKFEGPGWPTKDPNGSANHVAWEKERYWGEGTIQDRLEEGDVVYFQEHSNRPANHIEGLDILISASDIFAYERDGQIRPFGGKCFIKQKKSVQGLIILISQQKTPLIEGEVVMAGLPCRGMTSEIEAGDTVYYQDNHNDKWTLPEIGEVSIVRIPQILCRVVKTDGPKP